MEANPPVYVIGWVPLFLALALLLFFPMTTNAVLDESDIECMTKCMAIPPKQRPQQCPLQTCTDHTNGGSVSGNCVYPAMVCRGKSFSGAGQSGNTGLDQVMKALGELFGKLMQKQPKPPETPPTTPTNPINPGGCMGTYFKTSDISLISNPCAQYEPPPIVINPTSTDPGSCTPLNQALGLCTPNPNNCPDVPVVDCAPGNHPVSGGEDANGCVLPDACVPDTSTTTLHATSTTSTTTTPTRRIIFATTTSFGGFGTGFGGIGGLVPPTGARGDITIGANGATIIGGTRDTQNNVEVAGFYGSDTFGGQGSQGSQGLIASWCKARPWASNFLSKIVAPSFFDGLCIWRGYQVGTPPPPAVILRQTPKPKPVPATTTPAVTSGVTPKVDIWAVPASVPLGARTSIFWNTQNVTNCTETSPNGGFNQSSLSGGAATQPITAATTFTISCLAPDGSPVTGFVTVNLKI